MKLLFLVIGLLGFAIAAIAIKMFVVKGGMFSKSCSSTDVGKKDRIGCTCGDKSPEEECEFYEEHHGKGVKNNKD